MNIEELEKLNELKEKGILTQEEFDQKKKAFLNQTLPSADSNDQSKSLWGYFVECTFQKFACFKGRARRKEYWGFVLFAQILIPICYVFCLAFFGGLSGMEDGMLDRLIDFVNLVVNFVLFLPSLGVLVRRLHDVNFSGWWVLTIVVPMVLVFFKSDMQANKYGPVPAGVKE